MQQQTATVHPQQHHRFLQVVLLCLVGALIGALISGPSSRFILLLAALCMTGIVFLARQQQYQSLAISSFLWLCTLLISALITMNHAIYDPLMICYALLLVYAALFSSQRLFFSLLVFIASYCSVLLIAILRGHWSTPTPNVDWTSVAAINIILAISGLSAWFLAKDFKNLMRDLIHENQLSLRSQREIQRIATLDPLTGLSNRQHAEQEFNRLITTAQGLAIVFIDLDNFKPINDAYGHAYGDMALKILAQRIQQLTAPGELCCRFGGDEFVLILHDTDADLCKARYQQFLVMIAEELTLELRLFKISASIGVAHYPAHARDFNELCRLADMAMYRSKAAGRNLATLYDPNWQDEHRKKLDMLQGLRQAISRSELFLQYQPKYHANSLTINGAEALVRWQSADFGLVSPATFIPLAEETGLINDIGLFVLQRACSDAKQWLAQGYQMPVSVNLSPAQLSCGQLPQQIQAILAETGLPPAYLELEITESMLMQDQNGIDAQIAVLAEQGILFAIDDFGTGYSNLHYLSRFKAATLKIDQSFIKKLHDSPQSFNLIKGIVVLANTLGLHTVAEGVEDQATLQTLCALGCDSVQGFLLSKPVGIERLQQLLPPYATADH